ncbi:zinc phosphodiesterase ELAC protein 2 [Eurytemora carolleeae]|uniref:zinc phosphodiesterase ELAC protein 2 n=1 Tax=Eurytemora carolleeae TaxID=1294199 RepID=UPI000C760386|nr:zinc phosphodiesterase ELAC protein 2 [Eurytemora carolleeae]|eukprot:XP_023347837.1 zinc phosphodiesterase ELAC protein 2-like [Eurytemora affinis]
MDSLGNILCSDSSPSSFNEENCTISQQNNSKEDAQEFPEQNKEDAQEFPEIAFIGTGSSVPNINRNVSCIMIEVENDKFFMLDCGEGSLSELYRLYGLEEMDRRLLNLKSIFISHQHTDHHMGLNSIILALKL